jgi:hypothetical protein
MLPEVAAEAVTIAIANAIQDAITPLAPVESSPTASSYMLPLPIYNLKFSASLETT